MDPVPRQLRSSPQFAVGLTEADFAVARLGYHIQGKLAWHLCEQAAAELKRRHDISVHINDHCITSIEAAARAAGYNERMQEELVNRFGDDVIEAVFRELERKQKKERKKARPG